MYCLGKLKSTSVFEEFCNLDDSHRLTPGTSEQMINTYLYFDSNYTVIQTLLKYKVLLKIQVLVVVLYQ